VTLTYAVLTGEDIVSALRDVAKLRIRVFRDYPYLYDGSAESEEKYLIKFARAEGAVVVIALDGKQVVGASTGCLLRSEHDEFKTPFLTRGMNLDEIFYCAESVLLKPYRGHGAGPRFFALRETHGRGLGAKISAFCAVVRPDDHPSKPAGYKPLDLFWQRLGYVKQDEMRTDFSWLDIGDEKETKKPMQFWMKNL
jgi:GNAT superfamily N-acetyltransferase